MACCIHRDELLVVRSRGQRVGTVALARQFGH